MSASQVKESQVKYSNSSAASKKRSTTEKKIIFNARFVKENFGDKFIVRPLQKFLKEWTFRNSGETEWPLDTLFIQTNGDDLQANTHVVNGPIKPNQEITITLELVAPRLPGKYCAFFRFLYGDNYRFGQKVWCDILVQDDAPEMIKATIFNVPSSQVVVSENNSEERSSLLNESDPIGENLQENKPLDNLGDEYEKLQKKANEVEEVKEDERAELKKTINNLMSHFDNPISNLNTSHIQEDSSLLYAEDKIDESVNISKEEVKEPVEHLKKSELSQFEQDKIRYLSDLEASGEKRQDVIENLKYMMEFGYFNLELNKTVLLRHNNDVTVAVNILCNNLVTDSMFLGSQ